MNLSARLVRAGLGEEGPCRDEFRPGRESDKIDQPKAIGPWACLTKAELDSGPVLPIPAAPVRTRDTD